MTENFIEYHTILIKKNQAKLNNLLLRLPIYVIKLYEEKKGMMCIKFSVAVTYSQGAIGRSDRLVTHG